MSCLTFKRIEIKNFISFGDETQVYDFNEKGLALITGKNKDITSLYDSSNGSGKTSFITALSWVLFGELDKKIKSDDVVNNISGSDCFVKLCLLIDNDEFVIQRYRKHRKEKNNLKLSKNGKDISQTLASLTQDTINNLVGDAKTFFNSIMFSQEMIVNFLKLRAGERKPIIEKILQLDRLNDISKKISDKCKTIDDKKNLVSLKLKDLNTEINSKKDTIQNYEKGCKQKEKEITKTISDLESEIAKLDTVDIDHLKEWRDSWKKQKADYDKFTSSFNRKEELLSHYIDYVKDNKNIKRKYAKQQEEWDETKSHPEKCPTCKNKINEKNLKVFLDSLSQKINDKKDRINTNKTKQNVIK